MWVVVQQADFLVNKDVGHVYGPFETEEQAKAFCAKKDSDPWDQHYGDIFFAIKLTPP